MIGANQIFMASKVYIMFIRGMGLLCTSRTVPEFKGVKYIVHVHLLIDHIPVIFPSNGRMQFTCWNQSSM